jgi:hypothetical protein
MPFLKAKVLQSLIGRALQNLAIQAELLLSAAQTEALQFPFCKSQPKPNPQLHLQALAHALQVKP